MHRITCVQFTESERKVLQEAARALRAVQYIPDLTAIDEDYHRRVNGVSTEVAPITRDRLEKAHAILVIAQEQFEQSSKVQFWLNQLPEGIDPGDPENPMSEAYMAKVIAYAREGYRTTVTEAAKLLKTAVSFSDTLPAYPEG